MISDSSVKWIENLAEQEGLIYSGKLAELDLSRTKEEVLALSTTGFLRDLKVHCLTFLKLFNARMSDPSLCIHVGELADKTDGFFIQRNHFRLLFVSSQLGTIQIQCEKLEKKTLNPVSLVFSGQLKAKFLSFDDVSWFFLEKPVSAEQFCRFYLTEFIQVSRSPEVLN